MSSCPMSTSPIAHCTPHPSPGPSPRTDVTPHCVWGPRERGAGRHRPPEPLLRQPAPRGGRGERGSRLLLALAGSCAPAGNPPTPRFCGPRPHPHACSVYPAARPCRAFRITPERHRHPNPPPITPAPLVSALTLTKSKSESCERRKLKRVRISLAVSTPLLSRSPSTHPPFPGS